MLAKLLECVLATMQCDQGKRKGGTEWQRKEVGKEILLSVWDVPVHTLLKRNYFSSCLKWVTQCKAPSSLFINITESFRQSLKAFCPCWTCYVLWRSWGWLNDNSWLPDRLGVAALAIFLLISHFRQARMFLSHKSWSTSTGPKLLDILGAEGISNSLSGTYVHRNSL